MINIELTADAQRAVDDVCDKEGMKKRELVARVLRWFAGQNEEVRALVLGQIPKAMMPVVAQAMLAELAKGEGKFDKLVGHADSAGRKRAPVRHMAGKVAAS
jgi:hypothetical protein